VAKHYIIEPLNQRVKVVMYLEGRFENFLSRLVSSSVVSGQVWKRKSGYLECRINKIYKEKEEELALSKK
jgi:hypothetical protein